MRKKDLKKDTRKIQKDVAKQRKIKSVNFWFVMFLFASVSYMLQVFYSIEQSNLYDSYIELLKSYNHSLMSDCLNVGKY